MTLAENVALPLRIYTELDPRASAELAAFKLALVGLAGFGATTIPSEISGGMRKRAAIARAMALDPEVLFLDEPSAGLDPISSRLLDDLILELRAQPGHDHRDRDARARQHLRHRRQLGLPRRRRREP